MTTLALSLHVRGALVDAADLKGGLVDFATTPPYERHLRQQFRNLERSSHSDEDLVVMAIEALLFEFEYDDGSTILDRFLSRQRLTPDQRAVIGRWGDSVFGVFEVKDQMQDVLRLHNLLDELDYLAFASMGPESILPAAPGTTSSPDSSPSRTPGCSAGSRWFCLRNPGKESRRRCVSRR